ncbi:hypothetical protein Ddye_015950 [Dipteronia dyeriana]|uniref:MULE transposase domain-containing protein n=1 Tax=Dipteronia dyeriana TaxID=168575 RepID=A0AAD9U5T1_9ROSI|nr:hypothetical protein Ddye_015950 [Dipteronia dyeriana]
MQEKHGLHLLYTKAWMSKDHVEASIIAPPKESFKLLSAYCYRLKGVNSGTITASFSLAYGFGDIEDEMPWTWFLNEHKNAIGSLEDCMIKSDRHLGIKAVMEKVYHNVPHGYYVFHMAQNINNDYKRKDASLLFKQAWKAYRKYEFKEVMLEMLKVYRVTFEDLMNVRLKRYTKNTFSEFCEVCYKTTSWLEAYFRNIFPVGYSSEWNILEEV